MPKKRTLAASVNLDDYFVRRYYDERFLRFLRCEPAPAANYVLTRQDDKLCQFYEVTMQLKQHAGGRAGIETAEQQLRLFNRIAEQETNWVVYPLYVVAHQLLTLALRGAAAAADHALLEQCGRTIHRSFNLCLNDRNPEERENRRTGCYTFANLEFRLYHALRNRDMMKNLVKVLQSRGDELPGLQHTLAAEHKSHCVTYHYYVGEYYGCHESNFAKSFAHLNTALGMCPAAAATTATTAGAPTCSRQLWHILLLLVPYAMLAHHYYPNWATLERVCPPDVYAALRRYYAPVVACLLDGDVRRYDAHCAQHEVFFLRHGLFVAVALLRQCVLLKRFRNCWRYGVRGAASSVVPLALFLAPAPAPAPAAPAAPAAEEQQQQQQLEQRLDALECQLANQIASGCIRGYLSHAKRCIVLSKRDPFPRQCTRAARPC